MTNLPSQFRRTHELPWDTVFQSYILFIYFCSAQSKLQFNTQLFYKT